MRIAVENKKTRLAALACGLMLCAGSALAAAPAMEAAPPSMTPPDMASAPAMPRAAAVTMPAAAAPSGPGAAVSGAMPTMPVAPAAAAAVKKPGKDTKAGAFSNVKVPDSVKAVVTDLTVSPGDITLENLNAAREAAAKLDALIDIEKKLVDLDKLRKEREGDGGGNAASLASAIPPSALSLPPAPAFRESPVAHIPTHHRETTYAKVDIARVEGSLGHYTAFVNEDGATRPIQVGDRLSDGRKVVAIMADGIELESGGAVHIVRVKNVETVFTGSP